MFINKTNANKVSHTHPTRLENSDSAIINPYYNFNEQFNFKEMELEQHLIENNQEASMLQQLIFDLMAEVLANGCDLVSRGMLTDDKYVIEASFKPPLGPKQRPQIFLPVRGVKFTLEASKYNVRQEQIQQQLSAAIYNMLLYSNNQDLLQLIILLAHEFGHFKSYQRGFHDQELKHGLKLMYTKMVSAKNAHYTYQVFSEETTAWRFAKQSLERYNFTYWKVFTQVQYHSLQAYYQLLNLEHASVAIYCKLSMLNLDLNLVSKKSS